MACLQERRDSRQVPQTACLHILAVLFAELGFVCSVDASVVFLYWRKKAGECDDCYPTEAIGDSLLSARARSYTTVTKRHFR